MQTWQQLRMGNMGACTCCGVQQQINTNTVNSEQRIGKKD